MNNLKNHLQFVALFCGLFCALFGLAIISTVTATEAGTISNTISHSPTDEELSSVLFSENNQALEYISPVFEAEYEFNGLGLIYSGPVEADVQFYIQVNDSKWHEINIMEEAKDAAEDYVTEPLFISGNTIKYKITGPDVNKIQNIRITYFNSTIPPEVSPFKSLNHSTLESTEDLHIITREEWGADESYRTWKPDYITPSTFIIHHTAGGDGLPNSEATMRGIYYWHAVVLGWGDIGYNYVIDQEGNIYEGRYGGDGVIGAHAYNSHKDINYNEHSVGISIMGCFESTDGACSTVHDFDSTIQNSLTDLIAAKAKEFSIDPLGKNVIEEQSLKNILGHRDVDYTYCPGDIIHDKLKTIRNKVNEKYKSLNEDKKLAWHGRIQSTDLADSYYSGDQPTVTVNYNNVGRKDWIKANTVMQVNVLNNKHKQRVELSEDILNGTSGEISFNFTELPLKKGTYTISTRLYRNGKVIKGTTAKHTVTIKNNYQVKIREHSLPIAIKQEWQPDVEIVFYNKGNVAIPKGTDILINNESVLKLEKRIRPNKQKKLYFTLNKDQTFEPGDQTLKIQLKYGDIPIPGSRLVHQLRVD